jgi:uncharacterized protein (DUF3820 family)
MLYQVVGTNIMLNQEEQKQLIYYLNLSNSEDKDQALEGIKMARAFIELRGLKWSELIRYNNPYCRPKADNLNLDGTAKITTMPFGKYRDKNLYDILEDDPKYLSWCYDNLNLSRGLKDAIGQILNEGITVKNN